MSVATQNNAVSQATLRQHNLSLALNTVWGRRQISRAELARIMRVSKPAVTRIAADLIAAGYIEETDAPLSGRRGRPATLLRPRAHQHLFYGVDLRLDRVLIEVRDLQGQLEYASESKGDPPVALDSETLLSSIVSMITETAHHLGRPPTAIGIAVGASLDERSGRIVSSPHASWRNVRLTEAIRQALDDPELPVGMHDVARCATLANWRTVSADEEAVNLLHLQIGIGAGAGLIERRDPTTVALPGGIAHLPIDPTGPRCDCGANGCLDAIAGFDALMKLAAKVHLAPPEWPRGIDDYCSRLLAAADHGDRSAQQAIDQVATWIGRAAAILIRVLQASRFSLAGYPLALGERFTRAFVRAAEPFVPELGSLMVDTGLGNSASVIGAYNLGVAQVTAVPRVPPTRKS